MGSIPLWAQVPDSLAPVMDYTKAKDYEIGGITVTGAEFSDANTLISMTGLRVGDRIKVPGPKIQSAFKALWRLQIYSDVQVFKTKAIGDIVFLEIAVKEQPRLSSHSFRGVKKGTHDDLNEKINKYLLKGTIVTEAMKRNAAFEIDKYFIEKGYLDARTEVEQLADSTNINAARLVFNIERGEKVKIKDITFSGNTSVNARKLRKQMKNTKRKAQLFSGSKFILDDYANDKKNIIALYNKRGFRNAAIKSDSTWRDEKGMLRIHLDIEEDRQFYIGNITWKGNSIYTTEQLRQILGISKGDIYNTERLEKQLRFNENAGDVSSAYLDNGYLFFQVDAIEIASREDTMDLEIRIFEGPQARIDRVIIKGNDRTSEHVIRRELHTIPGNKFSRADIIRSQREIVNLGYFNPENLGINSPVNPERGTVDVEYTVEEKPADQLELSAGWGGSGTGLIGTLGVSFNNFSIRTLKDVSTWSPLPQGDGQRLSLRVQSSGKSYQSANASFTEPWLGGKKPNSFTVAGYVNRYTNGVDKSSDGFGQFYIAGATASLGKRLRLPDDFFVSTTAINFQRITLSNWSSGLFSTDDGEAVSEGAFNNFSITQSITRSSIDNPIFPTRGSKFSLSLQLTPPYSLFSGKDYNDISISEKYQWVEYHKWRFNAEYYAPVYGKLTLKIGAKFGYVGYYNQYLGVSPFERFQLGGDGLNNQNIGFQGTEIISLRGYEVSDLEANYLNDRQVATPLFQKITTELRYPLSLNPSSTIYALAFVEAGNSWRSFEEYNPFDLKRSFGIGLRVQLPMFGLLGFDYGFGVDNPSASGGIGALKSIGNFNIILGFEPD